MMRVASGTRSSQNRGSAGSLWRWVGGEPRFEAADVYGDVHFFSRFLLSPWRKKSPSGLKNRAGGMVGIASRANREATLVW